MKITTKRNGRGRGLLLAAAVAVMATTAILAAGPAVAAGRNGGHRAWAGSRVVYAKQLTRVVPRGKEPVLLEGGAFGPDGNFYFADVLARPGRPKILVLNPRTKRSHGIYTDKTGAYTSTQFDAHGKLWVTDFTGGKIDEMNRNGTGFRTTFSGKLEGRTMHPDDISFDPQGNMFVSDTSGTPWQPIGRVVRLDAEGRKPKTVMDGLASPNGVSFAPEYGRMWVSEYTGQREDLLTLNQKRTAVAEAQVGMHASPGVGHLDSNMVDAAGNIYQCVNEDGEILVWSEHGRLLETIKIRQDLGAPEMSATNLAIRPGTRTAYVVVGGKAGGFVYTFRTLAKGYAGSNGGSA